MVIAKALLNKHNGSIHINCNNSLEILSNFSLEVFVVVFIVN